MPLITPTLKQIIDRTRADVARLLPGVNPAIPSSFIRAIIESLAIRINAANLLITQAVREAFPQTATGANLERFAETISRNAASPATGDVVFFGNAFSIVPVSARLASADGVIYRTEAAVTLTAQIASISSLSSSGGIATAISNGHNLATGQDLTIAGANDAEYNGEFNITVVDGNTFTFPISGNPNSPTSGTITGTFTGARATVTSESEGVETNRTSGDVLTLSSPISGVENEAIVRFDGITGGSDIEDDESLRSRILEQRAAIRANFSPDAIVQKAREVPGVTRVKVRRADPEPGDVTVNFVRDNDSNIIPSSADVLSVRESLLEILPSTSEEAALIVAAPIPVLTDFTFSSIVPNTEAMKSAVKETLKAFYEDEVDIGSVITEDAYRSAILQTVAENSRLESFVLSAPSGNIVITADQIGLLGDVTFS